MFMAILHKNHEVFLRKKGDVAKMMRRAGILLPVFSLPNAYGIGTFGKSAYDFVDFLKLSGQSIWQILPLTQTGFGDSPYQSPSAFAGNPYFIDPDILFEKGYVTADDLAALSPTGARIDYARLFAERYPFLRTAYIGFLRDIPDDYYDFCKSEADWLDDYALFMAIKEQLDYRAFTGWDSALLLRKNLPAMREENRYRMGFWKFLQYEFSGEWRALRAYAESRGILIMGDLPIYVAADSADVWAHPECFLLDENRRPTKVAGVPPDLFSATGQLWGNPIYDWDAMARDGYSWWIRRFARARDLYDFIRIDHFVGFSNYYAIPATADNALHGELRSGVGYPFFEKVRDALGKLNIVAEDLGTLQNGVKELLAATGFPNMRVLQFGFEGKDNPHAPENYVPNCVAYTGTHDNTTLSAFWQELSRGEQCSYAHRLPKRYANVVDRLIDAVLSSVADTAIVPMQDYLRLGKSARINEPSTGEGNWTWMLPKDYARAPVIRRIFLMTKNSGR